ncbi:MAG: hypothetical protein HYT43_01325 [Candidatus Taylorbacteria bacterium]|nr:hypothetical protein [Candidatus Taylorbacteria bacterium]
MGKKFEELPEDIQRAFVSPEVSRQMIDIGSKFGLDDDRVGELGVEIRKVMAGATHPSNFIKELSMALKISEDKAKEMGQEINALIFRPVKDSIKKVHSIAYEVSPHNYGEEAIISKQEKVAREMHELDPKMEIIVPKPAPAAPLPPIEEKEEIVHDIEHPREIGLPAHEEATPPSLEESHPPREEILKGIENPLAITKEEGPSITFEERLARAIEKNTAAKSAAPLEPPKYRPDPYREPAE